MTSDASGPVSTTRTQEFRRLEVKYMIDRSRRTGLDRDLRALMKSDAHSGPDGAYMIRSLYFDSRDYMAYREKLDGEAVRHKLRVRVYGDPAVAPKVRLEIKSRYLNFIHKISADVPREEWPQIDEALRRGILPPAHLLEDPGVRAFFHHQRLYNLVPTVIVEYRRRAFERRELQRTRVNFDDQIRGTRCLDLFAPLQAARSLLGCGNTVFEVKVNGVLPFWMHLLIAKYDLHAEAISKYCHAVRSEARMSSLGREQEWAGMEAREASWRLAEQSA